MTPEEKKARLREWKRADYERHREKRLAQQREYRLANKEAVAARMRERRQAARTADPEKYRQRGKAWADANKDKVNAKSARWLEANAERKRETNRAWRLRNSEKVKEQNRQWWLTNKDVSREYARRRASTPRGSLESAIRSGIYSRMTRESGRKGRSKTFDLLGYSPADLARHLERQFLKGMTWENHGEWHIDHILPVASFQYQTFHDPDFRAAWALTNLRPMWATNNLSKGAKRLTLL
jgi:hypothetical protein